jgi:hypothetical protein
MDRNKALAVIAAIVGILLVIAAVVYFVEPASSLPAFFPGQQSGSSHHHVTHGIAALVLGVLLLIFAWFRSAPGTFGKAD